MDKLAKWVPVIITVALALFSLAANVGGKTNEVANLREAVAGEHQTNAQQDDKIQQIQIDRAADHQLLQDIHDSINEMKQDIKDIKNGRR